MNKEMKEFRELTIDEIDEKIRNTKEELFKVKHKHGLRQLENVSKLGNLRNRIGRLETVKTEKVKQSA